jgi:hypothetical protein
MALSGKLGLLLDKRCKRTIQESHDMATKIEANISSSKEEPFYAPKVRINDAKVTPDIGSALTKL